MFVLTAAKTIVFLEFLEDWFHCKLMKRLSIKHCQTKIVSESGN